MVFISKYFVPKGYTGLAIYPFVFLKKHELKHDVVLINHEKIHLKQQIEMLLIPFYLFYFIEFLIRLYQYENRKEAYRNISFEREAYTNESNFTYLKQRRFWSFLKYLRINDF